MSLSLNYENLIFSPLDGRYQKDLPAVLSEEALLLAQVEVEKEYLLALMDEGVAPKVNRDKIDEAFEGISFSEISEIEKKTQHATRALVEALEHRLEKKGLGELSRWVHVGITSFDTVDTALRFRLKKYFEKDGLNALEDLQKQLEKWMQSEASTLQVGRTHGQWAVPSLLGLIFGEANERIENLKTRLKQDLNNLCGQASGAVGGYQALGLLVQNPIEFEKKFLSRLGLKPHLGSIQILPPEDIVAVAQSTYLISSVVAKLAHDLRHLARSEIAEVSEGLSPGQVGSSTMPQKRNPWNLEHICSLFKLLQSRLSLLENDVLTEHQRDLTNSASGRFYTEFFCFSHLMWRRTEKVLSKLEVHRERMKSNLENAGDSILAEALYVSLTREGVAHAHDVVREASRYAEKEKISLIMALEKSGKLPKGMDTKKLVSAVAKGPESKMKTLLARIK